MNFTLDIQSTYTFIAWFATILFVLKLAIFMLTGGDMEVHSDFDGMSDVDTSFSFFSVQSVLAFLMGFGWMGLTALNQIKTGTVASIILSLGAGLLFMTLAAYLMFLVRKLEKRIGVKLEDYIGTEGKAYTDLHPNSEGQIQIVINNKLETLKAINSSNEEIKAFSPIKITKVENNTIYVDRM